MRMFRFLLSASLVVAIVCLLLMVIGFAIAGMIPGCHLSEGAGAVGCGGMGWLLEQMTMTSFIVFCVVLPFAAWALLRTIVRFLWSAITGGRR